MLAQLRDDVQDLNTRAREHMRAAGRLGEHASCDCPAARFAVGDHVLVKRNDLRLGVVNGDRGRVTAVDPESRQLTLDLGGEQVTLGAGYLEDRTVHGDPTLQHGYAMTVHVAQGLTVDHAFVLAGPGLNRELGYTALSRGRETNQLYAARGAETARVEYAPTDPYRIDPIARLAAQLATSSETTLAIDTGDPATSERAARRRGTRAPRGRRSATRRGGLARPLAPLPPPRARAPSPRRDPTRTPRRDPAPPADRARHGERPFVEDRDDHSQSREMDRRIAERRLQRELGRELGRGLER